VVYEADELAFVLRSWKVDFLDGRVAEGVTARVLRHHNDGSWKFVIDNPDGPALIDHA
jgi:ketosteroid isomerase-like protein